jgi:hypothetical protein
MNVLVACEFSGVVRDAFIAKGHNAVSCDLLPTESPGPHIQEDVLEAIKNNDYKYGDFDLLIAHPPCTYIANSGVQWLHKDILRWHEMKRASIFFKALLDADIPKKCIENPIPHKYGVKIIGRKYDQIVQPWMFGHTEKKATCLWLEGLPKLKPTNIVKDEMERLPKNQQQRSYYLPPGKDRSKLRSITFQGIADAMAEQWG